ncbi:hypothetical protein M0R72_10485 [Candidatus Pacearchaeota archaeon]|jgi:hypothetical protein|nr:hypothetical protein [Candidatus Pacearchaeota archaeon]
MEPVAFIIIGALVIGLITFSSCMVCLYLGVKIGEGMGKEAQKKKKNNETKPHRCDRCCCGKNGVTCSKAKEM